MAAHIEPFNRAGWPGRRGPTLASGMRPHAGEQPLVRRIRKEVTVTVMVDEHAFYEAEYAVCGRCEGSGVDPAVELVEALCAECDGWGEVEVERGGSPARTV